MLTLRWPLNQLQGQEHMTPNAHTTTTSIIGRIQHLNMSSSNSRKSLSLSLFLSFSIATLTHTEQSNPITN